MKKLLISKTPERSVDDILFDPEAWDYRVAWGYEDFAESENALRIYNDINDSLDNNKGFKEKLLFTRDSFNFYILYPASLMKYPRIKEYAS